MGICFVVILAYSNSLHNSFQFDDSQLKDRPNLHLTELTSQALKQTFYWLPTDHKIYRPLACLTLGLNYYFGHMDPTGYHVVNIGIHIACSWAVYIFILLLLASPGIKPEWHRRHRFDIAALTAFLFALHPLQTNVATYIIQRMTSLSALFFLLSLCGFLLFRQNIGQDRGNRNVRAIGGFLLMATGAILAILSKENSVTLPVIIVLIDYLFFFPTCNHKQKKITLLIYGALVLLPVAVVFLLAPDLPAKLINLEKLQNSYAHRDFTLKERLLTESLIVLFYLWQIITARIDLLNLNHEVILSKGLFQPPETGLAVLVILVFLTLAVFYRKKYPLISLVIFWYFINLSIESTVIPLELIYEHRTYLPGVMIFFAIASVLFFIARQCRSKSIAAIFLAAVLILYGNGTYLRNFVWRTPLSMWEDVVEKSPMLDRAYANYGSALMDGGEYQKAFATFKKTLTLNPNHPEALANMSKLLREHLGKPEESLAIALKLYKISTDSIYGSMAVGNAYLKQNKPDKALPYFRETVQKLNFYTPGINNLGITQLKTKQYKSAEKTFLKGLQLDPSNEDMAFNLIKLYKITLQNEKALALAKKFLRINPHSSRIQNYLSYLKKHPDLGLKEGGPSGISGPEPEITTE